MYKIGLTGGIASGKSTVLKWLTKQGVNSIDADVVAREVVEPGTKGLQELVDAFGESIIGPDGTLQRAALGAIVFSDAEALGKINHILHPHIRQRMQELARDYEVAGESAIVYDIPLLFESHWAEEMDEIWLVYVNRRTQVKRLMKRNHLTKQEALQRIHSQMSLEEKKDKSDVILDNSGTPDALVAQLETLWSKVSHRFKGEQL